MEFRAMARTAGVLGALGVVALLVDPALAQDAASTAAPAAAAAPPVPNKGDSAFMYVAAVLVLLMTVPGLALFYGGLVRTKNMLSMMMQVFATLCLVALLWVLYGYSMAFTNGGGLNDFVGGFSKAFLKGVDSNSLAATFSNGVYIPEYTYIIFQMTFACITPCLILGAVAERLKFSAMLVFMALWVTFIYFPLAHMVWYWGGPDVFAEAAKAVASATGDAKVQAQAHLDAVLADAGIGFQWGALDFAGGTVVHINSGIAALAGCLILGRRIGYGKEAMPPHSLVLTMVGAALLWVGWFGFNVGSNLEINQFAGVPFINTFIATCAAGLSWMIVEWIAKGKPSALGMASGVVAGLVAITPACGFAGVMGAIVLGLVVSPICFFFCSVVKSALGYDDSLDVFGVHCIGGIVGAIGTGLLVNPEWGGAGIADYISKPGEMVAGTYDMATQVIAQAKMVGLTLLWSGLGSAILFKLVDIIIGLRPSEEKEREGLDLVDHGESAYHY
ncbi:ammonium transporter [Hyphomicrobium sp.]|uniref:ammonium transporter n=1 Tax=Hyphomicrobium sp. TaxID=82 RepID=UPI002D76C94A|nr:ammonium transporter [Hyphomicrobium sp.]HET6388805.1 ammonium transporter [Hyphomicrobium sp.]